MTDNHRTNFIRVVLHEDSKESIWQAMEYDATFQKRANDPSITISVGDQLVSAAVTIPFGILSMLIERVMAEKIKRDTPAIIMPDTKLKLN